MRDLINIITEGLAMPDQIVDMKAAVAYFMQNVDWSSGAGEYYAIKFRRETGNGSDSDDEDFLSDDDSSIDFKSQEFQEWFTEEAETAIWDAWGMFQHLFNGDTIRVYRVITAPENWKYDPSIHPGLYWSWDKRAAQAHWGKYEGGNVEWRLTADLNVDQIDWIPTLVMNAMPDYQEEREIRVVKNKPVNVVAVEQVK